MPDPFFALENGKWQMGMNKVGSQEKQVGVEDELKTRRIEQAISKDGVGICLVPYMGTMDSDGEKAHGWW